MALDYAAANCSWTTRLCFSRVVPAARWCESNVRVRGCLKFHVQLFVCTWIFVRGGEFGQSGIVGLAGVWFWGIYSSVLLATANEKNGDSKQHENQRARR
jgi:hypothetical protein